MVKQLTLTFAAVLLLAYMKPSIQAYEPGALPPCWTSFYSRDSSIGSGDIELLSDLIAEYPGEICPVPLNIDVVTIYGNIPANNTGQVFHVYDPNTGFVCLNQDQQSGTCLDYQVRFECECYPGSLTYCCT